MTDERGDGTRSAPQPSSATSPFNLTKTEPSAATEPILLKGAAPAIAARVALDGFRPPPPTFTRVMAGEVDGKQVLPQDDLQIEVQGGDLVVVLNVPFDHHLPDFEDPLRERAPIAARLVLEDGTTITARLTHVVARHFGHTGDQEARATITLRLRDWAATRSRSSAWLGYIDGGLWRHAQSNLLACEEGATSLRVTNSNIRLEGSYTWILIGGGRETAALIDTNGKDLDLELVAADLASLQMTFGVTFGIDWLVGLDESGGDVAWAASKGLVHKQVVRSTAAHPPVPVGFQGDGRCWAAPFFARTSAALSRANESLAWVGVGSYLDSLEEHLDGAYLKLQVALEAMSHGVERSRSGALVRNSADWEQWVVSRLPEISMHAVDGEAARKLVNKVKQAQQPPSTDAVEDALAALNLSPSADLIGEVRHRSRVVHGFLMSRAAPDGRRDLLNDWERVKRVRVLLTALFARRIGYTGPINGPDVDSVGVEKPAPWWPREDCIEAQRRYIIKRSLGE